MKIGGHPTSFLVKYFEISQIPTRVFVLVKSEFYKNMGYLCAVLTTAGCCVYTSRHPLSLFTVIAEKIKLHASNLRIVIRFSRSVLSSVT